jgi:uncharacterized protein YgiM (DUF1202 family)
MIKPARKAMNRTLTILPIACVVAGLLAAVGTARAQVGTNVGDSMNQPMVVTVDNGNIREKPNPTAKLVTTVPRGQLVTMIGTANGGAWAHVKLASGLDGYIDLVQLSKPAQ